MRSGVLAPFALLGVVGGALFACALGGISVRDRVVLTTSTALSAAALGLLVDRVARSRGSAVALATIGAPFAGIANAWSIWFALFLAAPSSGATSRLPLDLFVAATLFGAGAAVPFIVPFLLVTGAAWDVHARPGSTAARSQRRRVWRLTLTCVAIASGVVPAFHHDDPVSIVVLCVSLVLLVGLALFESAQATRVVTVDRESGWERRNDVPATAVDGASSGDAPKAGGVSSIDHGIGNELWARTNQQTGYRALGAPVCVVRGDPVVARAVLRDSAASALTGAMLAGGALVLRVYLALR